MNPIVRVGRALLVGAAILVASACSGAGSVEEAADKLAVPAAFASIDAETLEGFEETQRVLRFSTDLSQAQACELARTTLQEWADQELGEPAAALPLTLCSYEIRSPANHAQVDYAAARVERARINDEFVEDPDEPGGVARVVIFFATDN